MCHLSLFQLRENASIRKTKKKTKNNWLYKLRIKSLQLFEWHFISNSSNRN